ESKQVVLPGPLLFQPGAAALALKHRYRGSIQVAVTGGKLRAINMVGLEQYLYGVVPSEMPYTWLPEALKAQAVAARSYALATRRTGAFDLYPDTRSQVYLGIEHEKPSTNSAVDATAGQVVLYQGEVAKTYFFSTSGGRTASAEDVWGKPVPYLVSVPDPYDSISPYHNWGPFAFTGVKPMMTARYRLTRGKVVAASVRVPVAPLARFYPPSTRDQLHGYVRPATLAGAAVLIQKQQGTAWSTVGQTTVGADGDFLAKL